jgi:hypothetical protein
MNRRERREAAKHAVKGAGARKHFANAWKGMCEPCLNEKHMLCTGCTCRDGTHRVKEQEIGTDAVRRVSETESGLVVVRKRVTEGDPHGLGVEPGRGPGGRLETP